MKILVTGSNGFIGSNVCKYLKKHDHHVIGMGRHAESLTSVDGYISCDMGDTAFLDICGKRQELSGLDAVFHLAADMRKDPHTVEVVTTNCGGTERLIQLCRQKNIPVFLQLSSLPVIGKPIEHPITENHPLDPYTAYHVTKVAEEMLAQFATKAYGIRTASFRISAPVGIGVNPHTIFPTFVRNAVAGQDIVLSGKGTRQQTYVHVDDIARALELSLHKPARGVYNLAGNERFSNHELAKKIIDITGSRSNIVFSGQEDDMDDYVWDVSLEKLCRDTGYRPKITMEQAIEEYADYIKTSKE